MCLLVGEKQMDFTERTVSALSSVWIHYAGFAFHKDERVLTVRLRTETKYDFGKWINLLVFQKAGAEVTNCKWLHEFLDWVSAFFLWMLMLLWDRQMGRVRRKQLNITITRDHTWHAWFLLRDKLQRKWRTYCQTHVKRNWELQKKWPINIFPLWGNLLLRVCLSYFFSILQWYVYAH